MKALTIAQPWAELLVSGVKEYETRSWKTAYRGQVLIHAAVGIGTETRRLLRENPQLPPHDGMAKGAIVGIGILKDCSLITEEFRDEQSRREIEYGDWTLGRYAWAIGGVRRMVPIPAKGRLGLWEFTGIVPDLP